MPIKNAKIRFSIFVQVIIILVLIVGCASSDSLKKLKNDQLDQEQGFQSIVFWRLKVIDRTNSFGLDSQSIQYVPRFQFYESEKLVERPQLYFMRPNLKRSLWDGKVLSGGWVKKDDVSYLDETIIAEIKSGKYILDNIDFYIDTTGSGILITRHSFTIDVDKTYEIPPGKLLYLGEFDVEFVSKKLVEKEVDVYSYNANISQNTTDFNRNLKIVQERYPLLYNQFKNSADIAYSKYLFFEDFSLTKILSSGDISIRRNKRGWKDSLYEPFSGGEYNLFGGEYILEPNDNKCHRSTIKFPTPVPKNFDIELVSKWKSGVDKTGYGLLLGNDFNNVCHFGVSGNGYSSIFVAVNGKFKEPQPVGWKPNTANKGNGTVANRHKVEVRGNVLNYYVNDKYIGRINNKINFKNGIIGVFVCDNQKVAFDDLKIK